MSPQPTAIQKTAAEEAFVRNFEAVAGALPENAATTAARRAAMARFEKLGLPHRRIEEWKYTDLRTALRSVAAPAVGAAGTVDRARLDEALATLSGLDAHRVVFVNGTFAAELSDLPAGDGVEAASIVAAAQTSARADEDRFAADSIVALNEAFVTDGLTLKVAAGVALEKPVMIVSARTGGDDLLVTLRHEITLEANAEATVIETAVSIDATGGQANARVDVALGDGAHLRHVKLGAATPIVDLATWSANLAANASYRVLQFTPGAPLARNQSFVRFDGAGGALDFAAAVLANGRDHVDTTVVVEHIAPGCLSRELFKAVLDDDARAVSQGKVVVDREAQKTDGKQMAQALMLSENAEFDSKPELEIYADDVACGHGSTSARIDQDHLFYLQSRGIPAPEAEALLTEAFIIEAIEKLDNEDLRDVVIEMARDWLAANANR